MVRAKYDKQIKKRVCLFFERYKKDKANKKQNIYKRKVSEQPDQKALKSHGGHGSTGCAEAAGTSRLLAVTRRELMRWKRTSLPCTYNVFYDTSTYTFKLE